MKKPPKAAINAAHLIALQRVAPGMVQQAIHSAQVAEQQEAAHRRRVEILHDLGHTDTEGLDQYQTLVYYDMVLAGIEGDREKVFEIIEAVEGSPFDHIQIIKMLMPDRGTIQGINQALGRFLETLEETSEALRKIHREAKVSRKGHGRKSSREI